MEEYTMKLARSYTRWSAIEATISIIKNLPEHRKNPIEAICMIDRLINGLLSEQNSPVYAIYQRSVPVLFPGGLERTSAGRDIILLLNQNRSINVKNRQQAFTIPDALRNPEKGVAQILGLNLAKQLFNQRQAILSSLVDRKYIESLIEELSTATEQRYMRLNEWLSQILTADNQEGWHRSLTANTAALDVLENYQELYSPETTNVLSNTALETIKTLLAKLPEQHNHPRIAIQMIDHTICILLMHRYCPYYQVYRDYPSIYSLQDTALHKKDILSVLKDISFECSDLCKTSITADLIMIIGYSFAQLLFRERQKVLVQLQSMAQNNEWEMNIKENAQVLAKLKEYSTHSVKFFLTHNQNPLLNEEVATTTDSVIMSHNL